MLIIEYKNKETVIRIHNDFIKSNEETIQLLESSYKLALLEIHADRKEAKEINEE